MRARKDQFFGTFDSAVTHLINTVEVAFLEVTFLVVEMKMSGMTRMLVSMKRRMSVNTVQMYFQDTAEVQEAKARFGDAFADAEAGIVSIIIINIMIYDDDIDDEHHSGGGEHV